MCRHYLGTPVEAYDSEGNNVWSAELDIYGRVMTDRNHTPKGDIDFIPFRYQGQYHDVETGLYYNRFRYYDPATGNYTQQDPIGLVGGNPTLYGYVGNTHVETDPLGLINRRPNSVKSNLVINNNGKVSMINAESGLKVEIVFIQR